MIFTRKEILHIIIKIALIELLVQGAIMAMLPHMQIYVTATLAVFLDPLLLIFFTTPLIAYFVIVPHFIKFEELQEKNEEQKINFQNVIFREERYALAAKGSNDGLWDWDIALNKIFYSKRWNEMLGFDEQELVENKEIWLQRVHPEDSEKLLYYIETALNSHVEKKYQCEYRILHKNEQYIWVGSKWITVFDSNNTLVRMTGVQVDIEKTKITEAQLAYNAMHDFLTNLPNRGLFDDRLQQALLRYKRNASDDFVLILFDLDNFKLINDSMGHPVGDKLLIHVSESLESMVRNSDTVARLGGDEFAVIIQNPSDRHAFNLRLDRMMSVFSSPVKIEGNFISVSVSMGVAWCNEATPYSTTDEIFIDADLALYHAKKTGKNRFVFYSGELKEAVKKKFYIAHNLKTALKNSECDVFYQPIVVTQNGQISGFEALLRWNHPELGLLLPEDFLSIAKESDVMIDLGNFAIHKACKGFSHLMEKYNPERDWCVFINISVKQLENKEILFEIDKAIKDNSLGYHHLKIEITESALLKNSDTELFILDGFQKRGIQVAIDDFGIGYSSLSALHNFYFQILKIDREYITNIVSDPKVKNVIKNIVLMVKTLEMALVIVGVENAEQYEILKDMKVDYIQGYYFRQALSLPELKILLEQDLYPLNWAPSAYPQLPCKQNHSI